MATKAKAKSAILGAVHETAADLHRLGFIDKRKMRTRSFNDAPQRLRPADILQGMRSA